MRKLVLLIGFILSLTTISAQKRRLEHADIHRWSKIERTRLSNDGNWVAYEQVSVTEGDPVLFLWNASNGKTIRFERGADSRFSADNGVMVFRIKPVLDTLKAMRRRKVKEEDMPRDTLGIYDLQKGTLSKLPRLKSFQVPEKWSGFVFAQLEPTKISEGKRDTTRSKVIRDSALVTKVAKSLKKPRKEDKEHGSRLLVVDTKGGWVDTLAYVTQYVISKRSRRLVVATVGHGDTLAFSARDDMNSAGVYYYNLDSRVVRPLYRHKGKYGQLSIDEEGRRVAFLADIDTTKARIRPWQLVAWTGLDGDTASVRKVPERVLDSGYRVSDLGTLRFSADGEALYLGVAPAPVLPDTSLLPEEIVQVEVWAWSDQRLYTEQEARMDRDKKQTFPLVWHIDSDRFVVLGDSAMPELRFDEDRVASMALGYTEEPYARYITWEGAAHKDVFAVDIRTGERVRIVHDLRCDPYLSPGGRYIYWWSDPDTAWYCWGAKKREVRRLTGNNQVRFGDEETDVPDFPNAYGVAGWMDADKRILIYDRYDIWSIDPEGIRPAHRLTVGREEGIRYRYIRLDPDLKSIPRGKILLHGFHERTKSESYSWLDLDSGFLTRWQSGDYAYNRQVLKAGESASMVFTRENFTEFPDLRYVNGPEAAAAIVISKANPQQEGYFWGSVELVYWTSLTGDSLTGMLVKPEGFDASKKYPMLVYFYERMTDELNRHRAPDFGRSSINWTFYASRGYLVFIPDIRYRTGYPGGSAYDAVMSGTTAMIERGFVDKSRVGVQGHSWGGYQTAYLITRTDLFVCAESGAPVVNMTSAYGGIRWESGLSRAFQYERQQSRIGGSLWEYPLRYLENSPLFTLDKVKTPVLILHNDKDGAVPWQQGIEFYSALRRLGKPCWLLNYNDEPHWPVKLQNRIDFQTRMQQFFDYYLLGSPKPRWMERGVPPMEKGILQGLETNRK